MRYVLESEKEFDRLEKQSSHPNYNLSEELRFLNPDKGSRILDAGCGSGVLSRHLKTHFPECKIVGCDLSQGRVSEAARAARDLKGIEFRREDLSALTFEDASFDFVITRFVLQHMPIAVREQALSEMFRVLKPGGHIYVIETDGLFENLYPQTKLIEEAISRMKASNAVELNLGRKLPSELSKSKFTLVTVNIEAMNASNEFEIIQERFENAREFFEKLLGDSGLTTRFFDEYLAHLNHPDSVYFFNKFVVMGTKPKSNTLKLVTNQENTKTRRKRL